MAIASGLYKVLQAQADVQWTHIHSHDSHLWNAVVEHIANLARHRGPIGLPPTGLHAAWTSSRHIADWAWLIALSEDQRYRSGLPEVRGSKIICSGPDEFGEQLDFTLPAQQEPCGEKVGAVVSIRFATANVRSLGEGTEDNSD